MAASYGQQPAHGASWARVQLVRGQSGAQHWAIDAQYPEARLTIGSAQDAGWQVQSVGVQPYHFELFWDGRSLWVADTRRVGSVTLNGRPIGDWVQIRGRSEISFGSAGMQLETADAMINEMASNPGEARRVTVAPGEGAGALGAPMAGPWDETSLPGEATRVAPPPSESMGHGAAGKWAELDAESTRIAPEGAYPGLPSLSGVAPVQKPLSNAPPPMRPRLGGAGGPSSVASAPVIAPPRDMARTITADDMSQHIAAAQQIVQGVAGPSVVVQSGYAPAPGFEQPQGSGQPQVFGPSQGFGQPQQGFGQPPGFGPPQQGFGQPPGFGPPQQVFGQQAPGAPPGVMGAGGPQSGFAAPPTFDQAHQHAQNPQGRRVPPKRTLILLAVTVVAALGAVVMAFTGGEDVPVTAPQAQPVPPPGIVPAALPQQAQAPQPAQPQPNVQADGIQPLPDPIPATPTPTASPTAPVAEDPTAAVDPAVPVGPTPDRLAADLVITGRYGEALPLYQQLATAHPDRPEYAQMVRILQQRLAGRCQGGVGPDGRPCTGR